MAKKVAIASIAVFIVWEILDILMHGVILSSAYEATSQLWRPMDQMKNILLVFVVLVSAIVFVYIYARYFAVKNEKTAVQYGIIFGIGAGISMGYGTYAVQDIPYYMALTWFLGTLVETTIGGFVLGKIIKD